MPRDGFQRIVIDLSSCLRLPFTQTRLSLSIILGNFTKLLDVRNVLLYEFSFRSLEH